MTSQTNLLSPGVSVSVTDQSFYIPAAAATVPLLFIATKANKLLPDGIIATGTSENNVIEVISSLTQSNALYGTPIFMCDSAGNQQHGDSRNEYGLLALNQFLTVGNSAFVIRADVDLDDSEVSVLASWNSQIAIANSAFTVLANAWITKHNNINGYISGNPLFKTTINEIEFMLLADQAMQAVYSQYAFRTVKTTFEGDLTANPLPVYENGYNFAPTGQFIGLAGAVATVIAGLDTALMAAWVSPSNYDVTFAVATPVLLENAWVAASNLLSAFAAATAIEIKAAWISFGDLNATFSLASVAQLEAAWIAAGGANTSANFSVPVAAWTPTAAASILLLVAQTYEYTADFLTRSSLGANDEARRIAIVAALQHIITSNTEIRSENYEYNLVLCPGYPEVANALAALVIAINEEAFIISDTPMQADPDTGIINWSNDLSTYTATQLRSWNLAYYYPPAAMTANLDGVNVAGAISGAVLAAYTYSDNVSYVWFAPAGETRGLISNSAGVQSVGYIKGQLGTNTTYVNVHLNLGQRDNLYGNKHYINPVINSPGTGLALWGQRVSIPGNLASARDRVNVERTIAYIRRQLRKALVAFLFDPNDQITRDNVKLVTDSFLASILAKRGLQDFATVCDATNNPAQAINSNELYIDIALKPMHTVEFIYVPIRTLSAGATLTDNVRNRYN